MMMEFKCWIFLLNINQYINMFLLLKSNELPELIHELCPYTDICNKTTSRSLKIEGKIPCCSPCGCDGNCGLRHDCCFDHLDKYRLLDRGMVDCVNPRIRDENNYKSTEGYFMVQACDIRNSDTSGFVVKHCRVTNENGSSLISPVSSLDTNLIYINEGCAACNEVDMTRTKLWNYIIKSDKFVPEESTVTEIQNYFGTEFGTKTYVPPTGEDWSHKYCYFNYPEVDSCVGKDDLSWQNECSSLRATFSFTSIIEGLKLYKNVFCLLCTGVPISNIAKQCDVYANRALHPPLMMILLDNAVIRESRSFQMARPTEKSKPTCPIGHVEASKELCLLVDCPEGMLMTQKDCTYFALEWYPGRLIMQIKLTPVKGTTLSVSSLPPHGTSERTDPSLWLEIPCREVGLENVRVYYSTADQIVSHTIMNNTTTDYITSFVVGISKYEESVDPSATIPLFHKCVTENWTAKLDNKTYIFDANFDKHIDYVQDGRYKMKKWPGEEMEDRTRPALYTPLIPGSNLPVGRMMLKKPFFCYKVRVPEYDVNIKFGEILIKSKNISLGTNEYIVNLPKVKGDVNAPFWNMTTFSVCIDDYDPSYTKASSGMKFSSSSSFTISSVFLLSYSLFETGTLYLFHYHKPEI